MIFLRAVCIPRDAESTGFISEMAGFLPSSTSTAGCNFALLHWAFLCFPCRQPAQRGIQNDKFYKRNGMPARPDRSIYRVADSLKSQGFISEMKVLPPGWPTSPESKFARFYKRNEPVDVSARIANSLCFTSEFVRCQRAKFARFYKRIEHLPVWVKR